jgi:hypothetical protein
VDVVGVSDRLCVLMVEMECIEFWVFYVGTDIMWVYVVGAVVTCCPAWVVYFFGFPW